MKSDPQKKNVRQMPLILESDRNNRIIWLVRVLSVILAVPNSIFVLINRIKDKRKNTHTKLFPQWEVGGIALPRDRFLKATNPSHFLKNMWQRTTCGTRLINEIP